MVRIAIVIPIHNEAGFLAKAWDQLVPGLDGIAAEVSVFLVENGSTDGTLEVAEGLSNPAITVISLPEPDYGAAMRAGFLAAAEADWVVNFDIDYSSIPFVVGLLEAQADIVIASKRAAGSDDRRPPLRRAGTLAFNLILRGLFGSGVSDTHGIKAFRGNVISQLVPTTTRTQDLFDTELVLRAERAGYQIEEVPVVVEEIRDARSSYLKRIPRTVRGLVQLRRSFSSERRNTRSR